MEKREMNIPRQWEKRVLGKNSPYKAKYKDLYPSERSFQSLSGRHSDSYHKSELERAIRNLSTQAKISLLQPELAKAKQEESERKELQSLLGPALGDDMDSLPDDPWFSKSPEEKHADVIQEEHGQYENIDSRRLPGLNPKDDFTDQWETGFVGEREGEEEGAEAANKFLSGATDYHDYDDPSTFLDFSKKDEGGSALDRIGAEDRRRADLAESHASYGSRHQDPDAGSPFAGLKSLFASDEDSAPATKSKGLSPMQKYGAQLITDIFAEKEGTPMQSIGASPLTPGRTFDMSYLKSRPKKERYRNRGLLGRA